jgi:hypothetical protein
MCIQPNRETAMHHYLELFGKIFEFVSFCLITPEFLQPATRQRLAETGASSISYAIAFLIWLVLVVLGCWIAGDRLQLTSPPWEKPRSEIPTLPPPGASLPPVQNPDFIEFLFKYAGVQVEKLNWFALTALKLGAILLIVAIPICLAMTTKNVVEHGLVKPSLTWLQGDREAKRAAYVGAWLFVFAFTLEIIAWFLDPKH